MGGIVVELAVTNVATIVPLELLPLSSMGFGWIVFALVGTLIRIIVGLIRDRMRTRRQRKGRIKTT